MAMIESALANALNALLEEERASVEMEVALASGATEYMERQALAAMGSDDLDACCDLHAHLERLGVMISRRIHNAVYTVLSEERYDARLRAFAHHQRMVGTHAEALLEADLDRELRRILTELRDAHVRHSLWSEVRANEFAATRTIDFRTPAGRAILRRPVGGTPPDAPPPEHEIPPMPPPPDVLDERTAVRDTEDIEVTEHTIDTGTVRDRGNVTHTGEVGEGEAQTESESQEVREDARDSEEIAPSEESEEAPSVRLTDIPPE